MESPSETVAQALLEIEAVHFYRDQPFTLTSGAASPVYIDCRKLISFPAQRRTVIGLAAEAVRAGSLGEKVDVVAGGETAGIPYAAWLADRLDLPMIYVRKKPKGFGRMAQIEGDLPPERHVLLFEDLVFDAGSKISFCDAIRQAGAKVSHTLVVFQYGTQSARDKLAAHGISLHALTDWPVLLAVAERTGYFTKTQADEIRTFLADPGPWSQAHGGKAPQ